MNESKNKTLAEKANIPMPENQAAGGKTIPAIFSEKSVTKSNELIQKSRFELNWQEQRIVLFLISQISPYDQEFNQYEFRISDFCRYCGIDPQQGKNYRNIKETVKALADKSLWIKLENGKWTLLRWIEKPYLDEKRGTISVRMDVDMKPYLLNLKKNFTTYELIFTLRFRSKYSQRLYEYIQSIHYHELEEYRQVITLEDLRRILGAENYTSYQDFKNRVLNKAIEEINQFSDKNVSYTPVKKGRTVIAVSMTITSKDCIETLKLRAETEKELGWETQDNNTLLEKMESVGWIPEGSTTG